MLDMTINFVALLTLWYLTHNIWVMGVCVGLIIWNFIDGYVRANN
jgi:hypothetical protein